MSMFSLKLGQSTNVGLSSELLDASDFTPERLLALEYAHDIAVQAFDPLTGLLVIGMLMHASSRWPPLDILTRCSSLTQTPSFIRNLRRCRVVNWIEGSSGTNQSLGHPYQIPELRSIVQQTDLSWYAAIWVTSPGTCVDRTLVSQMLRTGCTYGSHPAASPADRDAQVFRGHVGHPVPREHYDRISDSGRPRRCMTTSPSHEHVGPL